MTTMHDKNTEAPNTTRTAVIQGDRWLAKDDEIAATFTLKQLGGNGMTVPPGFFGIKSNDNGQFEKLNPGTYQFDNTLKRINRLGKALDIDLAQYRSTHISLPMQFSEGLFSKESLPLDLNLVPVVKIDENESARFLCNALTTNGVYTKAHLTQWLQPAIETVVAQYLLEKSLEELQIASIRFELQRLIEIELSNVLAHFGLLFVDVAGFALGHTQLDELNQERGKAWIQEQRGEFEFEQRQRMDELYERDALRQIAHTQAKLRVRRDEIENDHTAKSLDQKQREQRIEELERISNAETQEAAIKLGAKEQLAQLQQEAAKAALNRGNEQQQWAHIQDLARLKREDEIRVQKIEDQHAFDMRVLQQQEAMAAERYRLTQVLSQRKLDDEIRMAAQVDNEDNRRLTNELKQLQTKANYQREQKLADAKLEEELHGIKIKRAEDEFAFKQRVDDAAYESEKRRIDDQTAREKTIRDEAQALKSKEIDAKTERSNRFWENRKELKALEMDHEERRDKRRYDHELEMRRLRVQETEIQARVDIAKTNAERDIGVERERSRADAREAQARYDELQKSAGQQEQLRQEARQDDKERQQREERMADKAGDRTLEQLRILNDGTKATTEQGANININHYGSAPEHATGATIGCPKCHRQNPMAAVRCSCGQLL